MSANVPSWRYVTERADVLGWRYPKIDGSRSPFGQNQNRMALGKTENKPKGPLPVSGAALGSRRFD